MINYVWNISPHTGWFLLFIYFFFPTAVAAEDMSEKDLDTFRNLFAVLDSEGPIDQVLDRSRWPDISDLASYLELEILHHPSYDATLSRLLDFLQRWPDHAQKESIEKVVELRFAESRQKKEALIWFDNHPPASTSSQIFYFQLLMLENRIADATSVWKRLYLDGVDLPGEFYDEIVDFEQYINNSDREKRARSLIKNGNHKTLFDFLQSFQEDRRYYFLALQAASIGDDRLFSEYVARLSDKDSKKSELWYTRIEWQYRNNAYDKMYEMIIGPEGQYLSVNERCTLRYKLAKYFYGYDRLNDAYKLLKLNISDKGAELEDSLWLAAWAAHRLNYDNHALELFKLLAKNAKSGDRRSQGAWWAAELSPSKEAKKNWINHAAKFSNSFYGLLAMETRDGRLPDLRKVPMKCAVVNDPSMQEDVKRLILMRDVGRDVYNNREVEILAQRYGLKTEEHLCLAINVGAYEHAIGLASEMKPGGYWYWQSLYPIPHWKPGWGWQLDPALIWGITRQESMFDTRSHSSAQADGLLQIIPVTAETEARLSSLPPPTPGRMHSPAYNLALGQAYMKRMLSTFNGDLVLAVASYNAGPHRGEKWRERRQTESALEFIENIPFNETRNYVKHVVSGFVLYQLLMYGKGSILSIINEGQPGLQKLSIEGDKTHK
ncbi:MAG: lytic transglycosylase domain-containing protein [Magnetococcales bacterium]|nr:lytic transglycosylase domain-containing protein [Magnetococcales bacterium]